MFETTLPPAEDTLDELYQDFLRREAGGEAPSLDAYLRRCPGHASRLRMQVELHRALWETLPAAPAADRPEVPGYEILGVAGRGAMGVVYRARDRRGRVVAVKVQHCGATATPAERARFRAEAEALGRLRHPNVVRLHQAGEHGGTDFLVMEYVGASLERTLAEGRLPVGESVRLVKALAGGVQHAHDRGVVHRDLKPANVLLGGGGRVPKLADFGLAVVEGSGREDGVVGTPCYMAPEQAAGGPVTPAADVYGLGAVLYETLTGRPPVLGEGLLDTLRRVREEEPPAPGALNPGVDRALEHICRKCLRKEPGGRYSSARALARALGRWLVRKGGVAAGA